MQLPSLLVSSVCRLLIVGPSVASQYLSVCSAGYLASSVVPVSVVSISRYEVMSLVRQVMAGGGGHHSKYSILIANHKANGVVTNIGFP